MTRPSPALSAHPLVRETRRYVLKTIEIAIAGLESLKWRLEERPSRQQVRAWLATVFSRVQFACEDCEGKFPSVADIFGQSSFEVSVQPNLRQVLDYFPDLSYALNEYENEPRPDTLVHMQNEFAKLRDELADAYGLPAAY